MCPQVDFDSVARKIVDGVQAGDGEALRKKFEGKSFESVRDFIELTCNTHVLSCLVRHVQTKH
jgi:hypothetical protein